MDEQETIDLRYLWAVIYDRRWWIAGSIGFFSAVFVTVAFLMTPIYRAVVVMVPAAQERGQGSLSAALEQFGGLASLAGINVGGSSLETEEALAVLRSREFGERFIVERGLIPKFFPKTWDEAAKQWKVPENKRPTPARAFRYFDRNVRTVSQDKKTGLVSLEIDWKDRLEAADWANELVRRLNSEMRERAIARANAHLGYLDKALETVSTIETREAISRLTESQIKQRMLANVSQEYALRVIDKALPADRDDPARPRKVILAAVGFALGMFIGVGAAFLFRRNPRA